MPDLWMPGVPRHDTGRRLTMRGNGPRIFTHHTFEAPYSYSPDCRAAAKYLASQRSDPHFVFHPITGALIQMLPANTGGRTLRASGASTNTWGTVHMQVEVIAFAARPWTGDLTDAGARTLGQLLEFLRSWGIPDTWCHGIRPPRYPGPGVAKRQPTQSGHYHHAGWVVNNHGDPGQIADPWLVAKAVGVIDLTEYAAALAALGYEATTAGVRAFQAARTNAPHHLEVDGIFGPLSQAALEADMATLESIAAEQNRQASQLNTIEKFTRQAANRAYYQGPQKVITRLTSTIRDAVKAVQGDEAAAVRLDTAVDIDNPPAAELDRRAMEEA